MSIESLIEMKSTTREIPRRGQHSMSRVNYLLSKFLNVLKFFARLLIFFLYIAMKKLLRKFCLCLYSFTEHMIFTMKEYKHFFSFSQNSFQYQCSLSRKCFYGRQAILQMLKPSSNLFCSISSARWTFRTPENT